jgi:hypothetical protein
MLQLFLSIQQKNFVLRTQVVDTTARKTLLVLLSAFIIEFQGLWSVFESEAVSFIYIVILVT